MIALVGAALAEGFRMPEVERGFVADARFAFVKDLDGPFVVETTRRVQGTIGWFGLAAEVVGIAGVSDRWSDLSLGNGAVEVRAAFGERLRHGIGLRITLPLGALVGDDVAYWGTVPSATVATTGGALFWEGEVGRWAWRLHAGLRAGAYWANVDWPTGLDAGVIVATIQPLGGAWSLVAEAEALDEPSPFHLRALARRRIGKFDVDAGLAAPLPAMVTDPSVQVLARVAFRPARAR